MTEPTEADRVKANKLLFRSGADNYGAAVYLVAAAFAEARAPGEKLRADLLALAQEMDDASDARDGQLDGYFYAEQLRAVIEDET